MAWRSSGGRTGLFIGEDRRRSLTLHGLLIHNDQRFRFTMNTVVDGVVVSDCPMVRE